MNTGKGVLVPVDVGVFAPPIVGANHQLDFDATALEYVGLFWDDAFLGDLVTNTNLYAQQERAHRAQIFVYRFADDILGNKSLSSLNQGFL